MKTNREVMRRKATEGQENMQITKDQRVQRERWREVNTGEGIGEKKK